MAVIAFISPKGGVGKTTAATLLAIELAKSAKSVVMIDADPNQPVTAWSKLPGRPDNLTVVSQVNQDTIMDRIDEASATANFVVVDCEGTASLTVAYAVGAADLVIVPCGGSQLESRQAARALSLVKNQERQARRPILHAVLFTRTNPLIKTRTLAHVVKEFAEHNVRIMNTQLNEREGFRAIFSFGGTLETQNPENVPNIEKAAANAKAFAQEVVKILREPKAEVA